MELVRNSLRTLLFSAALLGAAGCATTSQVVTVAEDHTIRLVSRPLSAPAELVWRVKTFSGATARRMNIRYRRFPRLERNSPKPLPETAPPVVINTDILQTVIKYSGGAVPGTVEFLSGGDTAFPRIENSISNAARRIDVQTYIFDNDAYAVHVADLLRERSREGVAVRVFLDLFGSRRAWNTPSPQAPPAPHGEKLNMTRYLRRDTEIQVRRTYNMWMSSDHVKFITMDDAVGYLGGMNIGWQYRHEWRDMMSELRGPVVRELSAHFEAAWRRSGWLGEFELLRRGKTRRGSYIRREGDADLYFLVTTPWRHNIFHTMLEAIDSAESRIYVENPYLWNKDILHALCEARHRGVDVRVVIPLQTNIRVAHGADRVAANTLLRHKVRVFLYPDMTHKKAVVIDNWAFWGSANLDDLSMHKNMELNLATDDREIVASLTDILHVGQDASTEVIDPMPLSAWDSLSSGLSNLL